VPVVDRSGCRRPHGPLVDEEREPPPAPEAAGRPSSLLGGPPRCSLTPIAELSAALVAGRRESVRPLRVFAHGIRQEARPDG
jgi:hypothetical protein